MSAKTSWHRYGMKLRHCHPVYSESNGKWQILTPPPWLQNPEQILMKSGIYNYVAGVTTHANPCRDATTWVVSANTFFWFLNRPFFILGSRCAIARRPVLTIYTSYGIFLCKDVPFGIPVAAIPHLRDKVPKNLFWGREYALSSLMCKILKHAYYQNYCINSNQILHSTEDH